MENETLCKVLIVDDELIIRQGIGYLLDWEKEGFQLVGEASNGEEALQKIEELQPNIVLSDIVMPKMDGIDLTKQIQEQYPQIRVIILSSYSDFDYVKNTFQNGAVDYILKPTLNPDDLIHALKKVANTIPKLNLQSSQNKNVARLLSKYIMGFDITLDEEILQEQFPESNFLLLATSKKFYPVASEMEDFFQKNLYTECKQKHPCTFQIQDDMLCCLLNSDTPHVIEKEELLAMIEASHLKANALFVMSDVFFDVKELHTVYHDQVWNMLQQHFYAKGCTVLTTNEWNPKSSFDKFDIRSFNNHLEAMNVLLAMEQLKQYVVSAIEHYLSERELKSQVGSCLYNIISIFEDHHMNLDSIRHLKLTCMNLLDSAIYKEDFLRQLEHIYEDFTIIIEQYDLDISQDPMSQILKYIQEHYEEPLTLQDLADHFGFSYHYLSYFFAQRSDGTFTEHLNKVRIDKACELLNNKQYTIAEIGAMTGYSDHSYFCKVFKKLTGMTPSEYRKR